MKKASAQAKTSHAGTRRRLRLWLAFIAIFMTWALFTIIHQMQSQDATHLRLAEVDQKITEAKLKKISLNQEIVRLRDPEYIQELARKDQGMIKPGEKPIQVTGKGG